MLVEVVLWNERPADLPARDGPRVLHGAGAPQPSGMFLELSGWPTENVADDQVIAPTDMAEITGTTTYPSTDGGTRTVFVAEKFEIHKYLKGDR